MVNIPRTSSFTCNNYIIWMIQSPWNRIRMPLNQSFIQPRNIGNIYQCLPPDFVLNEKLHTKSIDSMAHLRACLSAIWEPNIRSTNGIVTLLSLLPVSGSHLILVDTTLTEETSSWLRRICTSATTRHAPTTWNVTIHTRSHHKLLLFHANNNKKFCFCFYLSQRLLVTSRLVCSVCSSNYCLATAKEEVIAYIWTILTSYKTVTPCGPFSVWAEQRRTSTSQQQQPQ